MRTRSGETGAAERRGDLEWLAAASGRRVDAAVDAVPGSGHQHNG